VPPKPTGKIRERQGVVCPKCGCREHYWKNDKQSFIWSMVHKLRDTMGKRDDRYMLDGEIEIDTWKELGRTLKSAKPYLFSTALR